MAKQGEEPTNRELMIYLQEMKDDVAEIKLQTIKTNGRVTALEKWMWGIVGATSIIAWLVGTNLLSIAKIAV